MLPQLWEALTVNIPIAMGGSDRQHSHNPRTLGSAAAASLGGTPYPLRDGTEGLGLLTTLPGLVRGDF